MARVRRLLLLGLLLTGAPSVALAQQIAIAGVVTDTTGAVLPGVTVEAASPALIEKVRTAITDGQGNYKIIDLRPGTYSVTITLVGFNSVKREGIELTSGFTATVNAELKPGAVEETITVTAATPIVDVQNVRSQNVLSADVLNSLPGSKMAGAFISLTVGAVQTGGQATRDVGGNKGEVSINMSVHGARDADGKRRIDGMDINFSSATGGGVLVTHRVNTAAMQEVVIETAGNAEVETGGAQINYVPKDGGNRFSGFGNIFYANDKFQGSNLTDALRARNLTTFPSIREIWDYAASFGGPIKKDKVWFFVSPRYWGGDEYQPGAYHNAKLNTLFYAPDLSRPASTRSYAQEGMVRVTWAMTSSQRLTLSDDIEHACQCLQSLSSVVAPEAAFRTESGLNHLIQGIWRYPATNRLLFEAGMSLGIFPLKLDPIEGLSPNAIGVTDLTSGLQYGALARGIIGSNNFGDGKNNNLNEHFTASYVTGSHAYRAGVFLLQGATDNNKYIQQSLSYQFRNALTATPSTVNIIEWASPGILRARSRSIGIFAQDQWKFDRLTFNYGARYDNFRAYTLPEVIPPARFIGERNLPGLDDVPNFKDVDVRLGLAYDVFGNGKTAVKAAFGRYVASQGTGTAESLSPVASIVNSTSRSWTDSNGDFVVNCDLNRRDLNNECGPILNPLFGTTVIAQTYAPGVLQGWGNRPFSWQGSVAVQHEVMPGFGVNAGYFRTWYNNFTITDNLNLGPGDYDQFCITVPLDSRFPGGGGNQECGLYDLKPSKVTTAPNNQVRFHPQTERYNGVDIGFNSRFGKGGRLAGGVSIARLQTINCDVFDSPQAARPGFCDVTPPWSAGTTLKLNAIYPLPWWGLQVSGVFQNTPGTEIGANYAVPNASIVGSLQRNLSSCPTPTGACNQLVTVALIPAATVYEDRINQLDMRFSKDVVLGAIRVRGTVDIFNVFNGSAVLGDNLTYATTNSSWLTPTSILAARFFKLGMELSF